MLCFYWATSAAISSTFFSFLFLFLNFSFLYFQKTQKKKKKTPLLLLIRSHLLLHFSQYFLLPFYLFISSLLNTLLWGQRFWKSRPISYQAQGSRQGERNVQGRTKKVRTVRRHDRGQFCSQQTEITKGENGTPPKAVSQGNPRESIGATRQLWDNSGRAILG